MNLTIAIEDDLLQRARELAQRRGVSLQQLIRDQLRTLAGDRSGSAVADELIRLMDQHGGRSGGRKFRRDDLYEDRV